MSPTDTSVQEDHRIYVTLDQYKIWRDTPSEIYSFLPDALKVLIMYSVSVRFSAME
jgi:hypothetical protein